MATIPSRPATQNAAATAEDEALSPKVSASALDFLLIELVPLAQRITEQLHAREQALNEQYRRTRLLHGGPSPEESNSSPTEHASSAGANASSKGSQSLPTKARSSTITSASRSDTAGATSMIGAGTQSVRDSVTGVETVTTSLGFPVMDEEIREAVFFRLDGLGYRVGQGLVERFSAGKPRPNAPLDAIKFVCKDLWTLVFRKQIDNLKTNHRGIFVLTDLRFQPLSRMSVDRRAGVRAAEEALSRAQTYLYFPCGIIRGCLAALGIEAIVEANSAEMPTAIFQIKTSGAKP